MSLKNTGPNNLQVRLAIGDVRWALCRRSILRCQRRRCLCLSAGVGLPRNSLSVPAQLTAARGNVLTALTNAGELRIMHNHAATFPPPAI